MITSLPYFNHIRGLLAVLLVLCNTTLLMGNESEPAFYLENDDCPDCYSSEILSETKTADGCTVYQLEVKNDGACRHGLSHYTVEVPCGRVSNIRNSENWKVEIGKDPTTGINGFKIDGIDGFGERGQPGTFTVEFTLCPDSDCGGQDCRAVQVAHKAGQCITTETLELCYNPGADTSSDNEPTKPSNTNCLAQAADGAGHAVWISKYLKGKDGKFMFLDGGKVEQFEDGTGHITGTVYLPEHPEDKWEIDVWMTDAKDWGAWSATGGGYKGNKNIVGDWYKTWTYYIMDPNKENKLIGRGKNDGEVLYVHHSPAGYEYAIQVGKAANDKNEKEGLSIWFTFERNGKLMRGDFNFDLSCDEPTPEPDCDVNELAANMITNDVSCANAQDGSITIEIIGGTAPFSFQWSNGATSQDISALGGGSYTVTITDDTGATLELSGTVFEPTVLSASGTVSPLGCGAANGSIVLDVSGGTAPYSYNWSNGSSEKDISGLTAGDYQVTVTDANGCVVSENFTLLATSDISATISTNQCNDGFLTLDIMGGVPPYSFNWSTGETTKDIRVTEAGTYEVTVTDVNGCSTTGSIDLGAPTVLALSVQAIKPSCGGNSDGAIDLTVTGGQASYTYRWTLGGNEVATTEDLANVSSGAYQVTVTDANGCKNVLDYFLPNPTSIFISEDVTLIRCDGNGADGAIDVNIFNAAAPYTTTWTRASVQGTFSTEEDLTGLSADVYTLTVQDANGCQAVKHIELVAPEDIQVDLATQYCGDGRICPTISGGTGSYSYQWTGPNGAITTIDGCIDATEAGDYTVVVMDESGCTKTATINIGTPNPSLTTNVQVTEPTCAGNDGSATVAISGGDGNYTILWSTGATTQSISGLGAGTYTVKVTDGNDCQQFRAFNIQDIQGVEISGAQLTQVSCNGETDGMIDITVVNGVAPYTYQWSNGAATEDLSAVAAGNYTILVTDANGCSTQMSYELTVNPDNSNCNTGGGDGGTGGGDGGDTGNGDGTGDGTTDPCIRDCNTCDGKISTLTLKYLGTEPNANITVTQRNGGQVVFDGVVAPEGEFSFVGVDNKGTLSSEIIIRVNGGEATNIHTSCSQPIGPGLIAGDFEVLEGESRNGGPLCPVEPGTEQQQEEEEEIIEPQGEDCAECNDTQIVSISETEEGCITYTLEVSNNGACAHELSHFSIRVPCGIVTEASNSRGWKMELNGKDPTTNLYGLKVDDIHGFEQEGSFTVSYTVCPNQDETCSTRLKSDDIIVGYKAAQCAKIETVKFNDQVANLEQPSQDMPLTFIRFNVYPNPVNSKGSNGLNLEFEEANIGEVLNVKVVSMSGRNILTKRMEISRENEIVSLPTAGMTPGIYFVTITSHHKVYSEKIIVK